MTVNRLAVLALAAVGVAAASVPASIAVAASTASEPRNASARIATFSVANLTCPTCPIAVKTAMQRVAGVRSVKVDFQTKRATVVFDPKVTNVAAIAAASTNAGYPARSAS